MLRADLLRKARNLGKLRCKVRYSSQFQSFEHQGGNINYEGHRPISRLQKNLLAAASAVTSLIDPYRGDMVAVLGETTSERTLRKLQLNMLNDDIGCRILKSKPIVDSQSCTIEDLLLLPENTFGYAYASFMGRNNISSDTRPNVHYVDNAELAYILKRYRQIHDFIHVLLGFDVNVPDEIVVKWFEFSHFGLPMTALSSIFGPLYLTHEERKQIAGCIPWAFYNGYNSKFLLNVFFEEEFEKDLQDFKNELQLTDKPIF